MAFSSQLTKLAQYLAGEFDNKSQAIDNPAWFVHLRLWKRPVSLFTEDSLCIFAEQANIVNLDKAYRPRLLRLRESENEGIQVQYYMFKELTAYQGAGRNPELLEKLTPEQIKFLPDCTLNVKVEQLSSDQYRFKTVPAAEKPCSFTYQGSTYQVFLGFEVSPDELLIYDHGIDPETGKATWGATMEPFRFTKRQDFSEQFPNC